MHLHHGLVAALFDRIHDGPGDDRGWRGIVAHGGQRLPQNRLRGQGPLGRTGDYDERIVEYSQLVLATCPQYLL